MKVIANVEPCGLWNSNTNKCIGLNVNDVKGCKLKECVFYKTKEELSEGKRLTQERLKALGFEPRKHN